MFYQTQKPCLQLYTLPNVKKPHSISAIQRDNTKADLTIFETVRNFIYSTLSLTIWKNV